MAAELASIKFNPQSHLILDQPLLRLPHELSRRNFKSTQRLLEREKEYILPTFREIANESLAGGQNSEQIQTSLDTMIGRMQGLKRKLQQLYEEEDIILGQCHERIQHFERLHTIPSLADVKYDEWARIRLNRLLVDHFLRSGFSRSATQLAEEQEILDLVDLDVFIQCQRISDNLKKGETREALHWCGENKAALRRIQSNLEFELRLQQYIEIVRVGNRREARQHAVKFLVPHNESQGREVCHAAGLLVHGPETVVEPYKSSYSPTRWQHLSDLFVTTHHALLSLSSRPLIQIALSAGLSALKTPHCHSAYASSSSNSHSTTAAVCPICSTELNALARHMPYAHHTKSYVESDPLVLPNGRVYGRQRLLEMGKKSGFTIQGKIKDPTTGEIFDDSALKKVYIS